MQNITIYIPDIYDVDLQYLKERGAIKSRSGAIREALKQFLEEEYSKNLNILNFKTEVNVDEKISR